MSLHIRDLFERNKNKSPIFKQKIINFLKKTRVYNILYTIKNINNLM